MRETPNRRIYEEDALKIFSKVADTVKYLHSLDVYHRDIKMENIMLTSDGEVKLIDFGLCLHNPKNKRMIGKQGTYHAPESKDGPYYCGPAEIYALGVIFFATLTGTFPYKPRNP